MFAIQKAAVLAFVAAATASVASAQVPQLDSLIATSVRNHPAVRAGTARVDAARAGVRPAGALPDPMLMAGIENLPLGEEKDSLMPDSGLPEMMTMKMIGVTQTVPFPGKLAARRRAAAEQVSITEARLDQTRWQIANEISNAYYELAYLDRTLQILTKTQASSRNVERAAEARYVAGLGEQRAVLDARVATTRFSEQMIALQQQRASQMALLAAAVGDSAYEKPDAAMVLQRLTQAADLPLMSAVELQDLALRDSPALRARTAEITAATYSAAAARKEYLPDFDLSLRYGQRNSRPDMISASIAVPIPIQKGRKQDALVRVAEADIATARAELVDETNRIRAEVTAIRSDLERIRSQMGLFRRSIVPQARAALESALASVATGKVELLSVIQRQTELLDYELALERLAAEFGKKIAQLESTVGAEVVQ